MQEEFIVYGARGSGSVAVEAALTLIGAPYRVVEAAPWGDEAQNALIAEKNPLGQTPAMELPSGELMTESAAMLVWLADAFPDAGLAPPVGAPERAAFLRWMNFVSAAIYALYAVRDAPSRWVADTAAQEHLARRCLARIATCWRIMEAGVAPAPHILGPSLGVLDLYAAVVSRWAPGRAVIAADCPRLAAALELVDREPRLTALWAERFPTPGA